MASLDFQCPLPAVLSDIPVVTCPEKFGQIQKLAIRKKAARNTASPSGSDPKLSFYTAADIEDHAIWTAAMAAEDDNKIILTPFISGFVLPPSNFISDEGNNNNTVNGIPILGGYENTAVSGRFLNMPGSVADALREIMQHTALTPGFTDVEVFMINEFGDIIYKLDYDNTKPIGFDAYNFAVASVGSEGLNKPNVHNMTMLFAGQWDKNIRVARPRNKVSGGWSSLSL